MDQPSKVDNPARGQLKRKNEYFAVAVRAYEVDLVKEVRQSRPASVFSFSISGLNVVLTHGIPPNFRGGVLIFI